MEKIQLTEKLIKFSMLYHASERAAHLSVADTGEV